MKRYLIVWVFSLVLGSAVGQSERDYSRLLYSLVFDAAALAKQRPVVDRPVAGTVRYTISGLANIADQIVLVKRGRDYWILTLENSNPSAFELLGTNQLQAVRTEWGYPTFRVLAGPFAKAVFVQTPSIGALPGEWSIYSQSAARANRHLP